MVNKITALSFLLITAVNVYCQQMGFMFGINSCKFNHSAPFNKLGMGLDVGLFYEQALPLGSCYVKTGIGYTQIRGNGTVNYYNQINETVLSYDKMQALHYAQIPLLFKYNFLNTTKYKIGIIGGVQYNLLVAGWQNPQPINANHNVTKQFVRNVLDGHLGFEYTKPFYDRFLLHILASYKTSLTKIEKGSSANYSAFVIGGGISYDLK